MADSSPFTLPMSSSCFVATPLLVRAARVALASAPASLDGAVRQSLERVREREPVPLASVRAIAELLRRARPTPCAPHGASRESSSADDVPTYVRPVELCECRTHERFRFRFRFLFVRHR